MRLREIHFNHNSASAATDAINLRQDAATVITAPEWIDGEPPSPAAYARGAVTGPVTVKVKLSGGPPGARMAIRAIEPDSGGWAWWIRFLFGPQTILGDVRKQHVQFDDYGESNLEVFEVTGRVHLAAVGLFEAAWTWQVWRGRRWVDFATSRNRIYVIPALPTAPWGQGVSEAPGAQYPWAAALEKACHWAAGATTVDEASELIAKAINSHPKQTYEESGRQFVQNDEYLLSNYLSELDNAASFLIDCRGVSSAVMTFANLLGAHLAPLVFMNLPSSPNTPPQPIKTKEILPLSAKTWTEETWVWHEVALDAGTLVDETGAVIPGLGANPGLLGTPGAESLIYDANVQLNRNAPFVPARIRFGRAGAGGTGYRYLLIRDDDGAGDDAFTKPLRPVV